MEYKIGTVIKTLRKKKKFTQRQLADNICSIKQLSRVEANTSQPTITLLKEFSYKLGEDLGDYFLFLNQDDPIEAKLLIDRLDNIMLRSNYNELYRVVTDYMSSHTIKPSVFKQYIDWFYGYSTLFTPYDSPKDLEYFYDLLKQNNQFQDLNQLLNKFIRPIDFKIISAIILIHLKDNDLDKCEQLLLKAISCFETHYVGIKDSSYQRFLYNLARLYFVKQIYEQSLHWSSKGFNYCIRHNCLSFLDDFSLMKGKSLYFLGQKDESNKYLNFYVSMADFYCLHDDRDEIIETLKNKYDLT